jgi:hypothetical protein
MIKRVRNLAVACARAYVESRERLGFPLLAGGGGTISPGAAAGAGSGTSAEGADGEG